MRVLWFTNVPLKPLVEHWGRKVTGTGFWIHSLVDPLRQAREISRLGIVYAGGGCQGEQVDLDGVDYYVVPQSQWAIRLGFGRRRDENRCLNDIVDIIKQFRPDLIHIHGTELFYGRLKVDRLTQVPTVVSIQGLMRPCAMYAWGEKTFFDMLPLVNAWEIKRMLPSLKRRHDFLRRARLEEQIINASDGIIGRTDWDRSYCRAVASQTPYFHVDEMMRPEFFGPRWSLANATRHRVYTSGRLTFPKGMHVFLESMALLKRDYPDLQVRIAGENIPNSECLYLKRQVAQLGLEDLVSFLGWIPGPRIVEELQGARCYVNTSFIENGCNALQEAMLLGCPCVATFTGGMATTLLHRRTGIMAPSGCTHMFADAVREYFESDTLCETFGAAARQVAISRHDPHTILDQLLNAYRAVSRAHPSQSRMAPY